MNFVRRSTLRVVGVLAGAGLAAALGTSAAEAKVDVQRTGPVLSGGAVVATARATFSGVPASVTVELYKNNVRVARATVSAPPSTGLAVARYTCRSNVPSSWKATFITVDGFQTTKVTTTPRTLLCS